MRLLPRRVSARAKNRIKKQSQTPLGHKTTHRYKHSSGGAWLALCDAAALVVVMSPRVAWWCVVWHVDRAVAVAVAVAVSVSLVRARWVAGLVTSCVRFARHALYARVIRVRVRVRRFCEARHCGCGLPPQVGVVVSSCRYVAAGRSRFRSLARAGEGGVVGHVRTMRRHPDGRADDGGAADSPARAS